MLVDHNAGFGKASAVDNAGVVIFVAKNDAFAIAEGGENAYVGHIACVKEQSCLSSLEAGQLRFKLLM